MSLISDAAASFFFSSFKNLFQKPDPKKHENLPLLCTGCVVVVSGKLESWGVNCERRQSPFITLFPSFAPCRRLQESMKQQEEARHLLAYIEQVVQNLSS